MTTLGLRLARDNGLRTNPRPRYRDSVHTSIRTLRTHVEPVDKILPSPPHYLRKVSCYPEPSRKKAAAVERAVDVVSAATEALRDAEGPEGTRADPALEPRPCTRGVPT
jgi:hypothetical protein